MDNARKKRKYRAIVACLLLLTMMPFFFVKAFHVHKEDLCISHDEQQSSHHDSADKCAICLFTLSSFTEAESFEYNCVQTENPVEYLIQKEKDITVTFLSIAPHFPFNTRCSLSNLVQIPFSQNIAYPFF